MWFQPQLFNENFLAEVINCCSVAQLCPTLQRHGLQHARLPCFLTMSWSFPKFMFIALMMPSSHPILWHPLLFLHSIFPSIRDFSNELAVHIRWPKYWSFSFSINLSSEYSGLISLKTDCFDLLAVWGTFRSLLQHHSLKASILRRSVLFTVQLSQLYLTALTIQTFVSKVMPLLFNTPSRFVVAFLPRSNRPLISWLQSLSTVILKPKKRKSLTTSTVSPSICHAVMGPDAMILVFLIFSHKPALSFSSFTLIRRLFSSSKCCGHIASYMVVRAKMWFQPHLIIQWIFCWWSVIHLCRLKICIISIQFQSFEHESPLLGS